MAYLFPATAVLTVNGRAVCCVTNPLQDCRFSRICSSYDEDSDCDLWNRSGLFGAAGLCGTHCSLVTDRDRSSTTQEFCDNASPENLSRVRSPPAQVEPNFHHYRPVPPMTFPVPNFAFPSFVHLSTHLAMSRLADVVAASDVSATADQQSDNDVPSAKSFYSSRHSHLGEQTTCPPQTAIFHFRLSVFLPPSHYDMYPRLRKLWAT